MPNSDCLSFKTGTESGFTTIHLTHSLVYLDNQKSSPLRRTHSVQLFAPLSQNEKATEYCRDHSACKLGASRRFFTRDPARSNDFAAFLYPSEFSRWPGSSCAAQCSHAPMRRVTGYRLFLSITDTLISF